MALIDIFAKLDPWRLTIRRDDARLKELSEEETRYLRGAQFGAIVSLTPTMLFANVVNVLIIWMLFWDSGHDVFLILWGVSLSLVLAAWYLNWRQMGRSPRRSGASRRGVRRLTFNSSVLGVLWATPIVYLLNDADRPEAIILASLAAGIVGAGALVMATVWQAALAFTLIVTIPSMGNLARIGGPIYLYLATMMMSYTIVIARTVYKQANVFIDSQIANSKLRTQSHIIGLLLKDFEEGASDFLWETDAEARLTRVSARLAELVGRPRDELEGRHFASLLRELNEAATVEAQDFAARLGSREPFRDHIVALTVDGRRRLWSMTGKPVLDARSEFHGFRGVGSDVTDAERLANYDPLTGLPNRSLFEREAEKAIARYNRDGQPFAVMTLDLDRFKRVNDTLGHAVGDALLLAAAARISECLGEDGVVSRFGGDEFVVLLETASVSQIRSLSQKLIDEISRPFEIGDFRVMVGASIGIALAPGDGGTFDTLLRNSDLALYRAKSDGRGLFCFFEASLDDLMQARRQLEVDLREAQRAGQLSLHFQPLIDTHTGAITSCEALLRWRHPVRGDVPPGEFIPLAEETGLVSSLGEWALEEACREAVRWPREIRVAVNISPIQFRMGDIDKTIARALAASGLPADRLEVEITESLFIENKTETQETLKAIHELGVRIALDDFGTGYSSLSYLCGFAFDKIKIDESFVHGIDGGANGALVVRTIAALAGALGVRMTAEGVETEAQLSCLASFGCHEAQGYLFSRPLSARDIGDLLGSRTGARAERGEMGGRALAG